MKMESQYSAGSRWNHDRLTARNGLSRIELIIISALLVLFLALALPAILSSRESARHSACVNRLHDLGVALRQYHDSFQSLPPAANWHPGRYRSMMLNQNRRVDLLTYQNWAILLLPHIGKSGLADVYDISQPIGADENTEIRTTMLDEMRCPSDSYNRLDNHHLFQLYPDEPPQVEFARGNYAINLGTQCHRPDIGNSSRPAGEGVQIIADADRRVFQYAGSGIAGINRSFTFDDFQNGQSTLVALEEVRAGIHPLDARGVWSLGQIGGSITSAHGISGDDCGPNNQWARSDDVLGCGRLHAAIGAEALKEARMPCVHYVDRNDQATARSMHEQGVNVLFLDGAVRFVNDQVDRGLWHVMHSRETPAEILSDQFETRLSDLEPPLDAEVNQVEKLPKTISPGESFKNSLGMSFVVLPAGEFQMGIPDVGNGSMPPEECPVHLVQITESINMGQYEVTQQQYEAVMVNNPSFHKINQLRDSVDHFPVEQVTWNEASEFCQRLSELPEEQASGRRYRLPTEAEWEYACRSGKSEAYEWIAATKTHQQTGENAGLAPPLEIQPVGSYSPNEFQLYDMRGNVFEWCSDWFDRSYYSRSPKKNPQGPASGYLKVVRGSDWIFVGEVCRINYPILAPWKSNRFIGFRVVCEVVP
ncbi:Serine/threonine-protein kinase pkn1 [Gimesia chilikensis]|uniref:Serine/threonine-protein kinase pkn1 n=1 Tax=Gimesia chilikensis TaxID=2605989 RepID=A0A517WJH4_9PLAN|nr:SUMF1/EgtB/PvdO family nonheme iron enzyme [Gimesia chilikensis]QDU05395.1 Serine/threonine-protein kinase pkn1 [Gimesia chilikensis]